MSDMRKLLADLGWNQGLIDAFVNSDLMPPVEPQADDKFAPKYHDVPNITFDMESISVSDGTIIYRPAGS